MQISQEAPTAVVLGGLGAAMLAESNATTDKPAKGWGACSVPLCGCSGYESDSQHDGTCICGHTAANHG